MEQYLARIRHALQTTVGSAPIEERRAYRCTRCHCTYRSKFETCPECGGCRLVRFWPDAPARRGRQCKRCGSVVDPRHVYCPECRSHRFDRVV